MPSGFYTWSVTASANGNADSSINWQTGMSASSVEPSSRAEMARLREFGNDISGSILTTGTSTSYVIATAQNFDTLAHLHGQMVAFVPHTTNGAVVTLNVDGLGAKPLRSSPAVELGAGVLVQGSPYVVTYNNSDGAFYLQNFFGNPFNIPIGGLMPYLGATAPNANFVLPFGQAISRTTYATFFALTSTTFGAGDGVTTFNVPDLRERAIFGLGNMGGSDAGRITVAGGNFDGTVLGGTGGGQNQTLTQAQLPAVAPTFSGSATSNGQEWFGNSLTTVALGGSASAPRSDNFTPPALTVTGTISNLGSGQSHPIMPPAMVLPYILRII